MDEEDFEDAEMRNTHWDDEERCRQHERDDRESHY